MELNHKDFKSASEAELPSGEVFPNSHPISQEMTIKWCNHVHDIHAVIIAQSLSYIQLCDPFWLQHSRLPCSSPSTGVCSDSCLLSRWCHPTISSSVPLFSSCPQSFPASGYFPMSHLFASYGQSIGASASAPVLPINVKGWFPLGLTGLISQFMGLSRVFFSTTLWKNQFFGFQPSLWSNSHICTWLLEKP